MRRSLWAIAGGALLAIAIVSAVLWYMNRDTGWNAEAAIAAQAPDARAEGRVGVVVVALLQPSTFDTVFYDNFVAKLLRVAIPWPINRIAGRDSGVALIDPDRPDETEPFAPTSLMTFDGRTRDWDGVPFVDKWRRGQVDWVKPSDSLAGDIGSFVYPNRAGGAAGPAQRAMLKARALYYARLPNGYLPQRAFTIRMADAAFAELAAHPSVKGTALFDAFAPADARAALYALLDQGMDTLVVASALPIHSAFEEYRGAFPKLHAMVEDWARERGKPAPKLLFAPQISDVPAFASFWADHIARTAPPPPAPDAAATLVISLHGLPIRQMARDNWVRNADRATARMAPVLEAAMQARGWANVHTVIAQEAFGDEIEDPDNKLRSTAEVFRAAARRGDALAFAVPVEFLAENTDTLFLHAYLMFDGLPGYRRFEGPPDGTNWELPLIRRFREQKTELIYAGTPGGAQQAAAGTVLADAIRTRLPPVTSETP